MPRTNGSAVLSRQPVDELRDRLNEPQVAAAVSTLLDNAELLALLVRSVDDLLRRSETISEQLAAGIRDARAVAGAETGDLRTTAADLAKVGTTFGAHAEEISGFLDSDMLRPAVINVLSLTADAIIAGNEVARKKGTRVVGLRGALTALKDPQVQRGLGLLVEVTRAMGRQLGK